MPLLSLRDRMKASVSESQEFETEENGIDMSFDMEAPLEGMVIIHWKFELRNSKSRFRFNTFLHRHSLAAA